MKILLLIDVEPKQGVDEETIRTYDATMVAEVERYLKFLNTESRERFPWYTKSVR